jgi:hypothetical protein
MLPQNHEPILQVATPVQQFTHECYRVAKTETRGNLAAQSHRRARDYQGLSPQNADGHFAFMVSNYSGQKRRFDSYGNEADALDAAGKLARQLSARDVMGAAMTRDQSV